MAYLKVLCDEVFGRENLLNVIVVEMASTGGLKRTFKNKRYLKTKEYLLIYTKSIVSDFEITPCYDVLDFLDIHFSLFFDGKSFLPLKQRISETFSKDINQKDWLLDKDIKKFVIDNADNIWQTDGHGVSSWVHEKDTLFENLLIKDEVKIMKATSSDGKKYEIIKTSNGKTNQLAKMQPLSWKIELVNGKKEICNLRGDIWKDFSKDMGNVKKEGNVEFKNGKKPERLLYDLIRSFTSSNSDLVLDAYFGTGTTGAVALKMNRRFIGIEQLDSHFEKARTRLKNVIAGDKTGISEQVGWKGGGSFVCCELKKLNQNFIDEITKAGDEETLHKIASKIFESAFLTLIDIKKAQEEIQNCNDVDLLKKMLFEILDKNQLYVNYCDRDDEEMKVSEEEKEFSKSFYGE